MFYCCVPSPSAETESLPKKSLIRHKLKRNHTLNSLRTSSYDTGTRTSMRKQYTIDDILEEGQVEFPEKQKASIPVPEVDPTEISALARQNIASSLDKITPANGYGRQQLREDEVSELGTPEVEHNTLSSWKSNLTNKLKSSSGLAILRTRADI